MRIFRRTTILALVVAMLALPTAAFAADDAGGGGETDRPAVTDEPTDRATDHRTFEQVKKRALDFIDAQLRVLGNLSYKIDNNRFITPGHAGQLRGDINQATNGLESLRRKVEDAQNWEELRPLLGELDKYKVMQVIAPKTHQVIASDAMVAGSEKLSEFADKLGSVIARFEEAGFDVTEAWRMLDEMETNISEGYRLASPVAGNVIGLSAADWPDPAQGILAAGRADLHEAGANLKGAHRIGWEIVKFLRNLFDGVTDVSTAVESDAA